MAKKRRAKAKAAPFEAFPHLDDAGAARMVDVGKKPATQRQAVAEAFVRLSPETLRLLEAGALSKGDALSVARVAGIMGAKKTSDLIPLCHPLALSHVVVEIEPSKSDGGVWIETRVEATGTTGVEMEALTAAAVAALSLYDMVKKQERGAVIEKLQLRMKSGGASGRYLRGEK